MRYQFLISAGAQEDMHRCRFVDPYAARRLLIVLQEIESDALACESLVDEHHYDHVVESVAPLWTLQDMAINAYRIRIVEVAGWRLITAADHRTKRVGLFAVMPRSDDYERKPDLMNRIEKEYEHHGFHRLF